MDSSLRPEARARLLLAQMTLEEKVGQMTQAERGAVTADPSLITTWRLGSLLSGGGSVPTPNTPQAWADMVDGFQARALQTRLGIPLVYGVDSVHGHGNLVGATVFPHNIGLGATRNPRLVEQIEHVTAIETRATGPQWVFAPCVCVARDLRWGRTYESFSENPGLVIRMETAIDGFQGPRARELSRPDQVLATAKHYAGDGDTAYGTGSGDYPSTRASPCPAGATSPASTWPRTCRRSAGTTSAASCRRSPASTSPTTASGTRSRCTLTASSSPGS
jgi:beta-glucosidase